MGHFRGVFPAHVTPMDADGKLNEAAFREVMESNIRAGVHGFWVAGGTGESVYLDDEENERIAEIAAEQSGGRTKVIMHVGAPTTRRASRLAEHAARAGVDAICCVPPFFYKPGDEGVVEHYRAVAAAADLPLFVYNLPQSTGVEITPELMQKIQDRVPQLAGLKHSSLAFANIRTFAEMGLECFTGSNKLLLPALTIGACGVVDGPPNFAPELWVDIWNAYHAGDPGRAEERQRAAAALSDIITSYPYPSGLKALIGERLGIDCGAARPPLRPLADEQRAELLERVGRAGFGARAAASGDA